MKPAGYLTNTKNGLQGEHGFIYDYILAENGLFLEAASPLIEARVCIAPVLVRGLSPLEEKIVLPKGRVPDRLSDLALSICYADIHHECYMAITWDGEYHLQKTEQEQKEAHVRYLVVPNTFMDVHSHGIMPAWSSSEDTGDEQGFRLSMVIGKLNEAAPEIYLRLCIYGYFREMEIEEVLGCKHLATNSSADTGSMW